MLLRTNTGFCCMPFFFLYFEYFLLNKRKAVLVFGSNNCSRFKFHQNSGLPYLLSRCSPLLYVNLGRRAAKQLALHVQVVVPQALHAGLKRLAIFPQMPRPNKPTNKPKKKKKRWSFLFCFRQHRKRRRIARRGQNSSSERQSVERTCIRCYHSSVATTRHGRDTMTARRSPRSLGQYGELRQVLRMRYQVPRCHAMAAFHAKATRVQVTLTEQLVKAAARKTSAKIQTVR